MWSRVSAGSIRSPFHGKISSLSYADGHAEMHSWVEESTVKAATDSANGIDSFYWAGGNANNRDFAWVYQRYKHRNWTHLPAVLNNRAQSSPLLFAHLV